MQMLATAAGWRPRAMLTLPSWMLAGLAELSELRSRFTGREAYPSRQGARVNRYTWYVRSDRAVRELGYSQRPLAETLRDTFAWYEALRRGPLRPVSRWWFRPAA